MRKLPSAAWPVVHQGLMALGMSAAVSLAVTYINTGLDAGFVTRWLSAWARAFPVAWIGSILWAPFARRIAALLCTPP